MMTLFPRPPLKVSLGLGQEVMGGPLWESLGGGGESIGQGRPLGGVAFPGNGLCPLSQAQASLRLPGGSEAGAGQALSRLTAPRRARLPPQRGLPGLACLWRGTQLTSWTPEVGQLTFWGRVWPPPVGAVLGEPMLTLCRNSLTANRQKGLPGS